MGQKLRVAVLFGGKSGEHEVSLMSAASLIRSMDPGKYEVFPIAIDKEGKWQVREKAVAFLEGKVERDLLDTIRKDVPSTLPAEAEKAALAPLDFETIDVVFPVLHGTYGEDGTVQGLLELAQVPYVGAGVLASAVGMDKVMMKKVFAQEGIPQVRFTHFLRHEMEEEFERVVAEVEDTFGYPCFVKPANLGSSVGVSKAKDRESLIEAMKLAARYDRKVIVEEFVPAREVEVAVLGNDRPVASVPGEIVSSNEFYDYRAKYIDGKSEMRIPAELPEEKAEEVRRLAVKCFRAIDCSGLARVDFFIRKDNHQALVNEINTMPGFTQFSMYAKLWEHTGLSYPELVDRLIQLAIERHREKEQLVTTYEVDE
ncbi:MAG: D-alanine--D-alanine ligase [Planifilum fimeticola]